MKYLRFTVVVLVSAFCIIYCHGIVFGSARPVLATWLIFLTATQLSMITYLRSSEKRTLSSNIYGLADAINVILVIVAMLFFAKDARMGFDRFEIACLVTAGIIAIIWYLSQSHFICNLMIQCLMVVAYVPFVHHLWLAGENSEPYIPWLITMTASSLALYEQIVKRDVLAVIYLARSTISVFTVLMLMLRLDFF